MSAANERPEGALWDTEEAASFLGMSASWVVKRARAGDLPAVRVGRKLKFDPAKLRALVSEGSASGPVKVTGS